MSRVLLLEDHEVLRRSMAEALSDLVGVTVVPAGTLADATAALEAARPDLVISDLDLPDGSGIELMGHLGSPPSIPIVFVSAHVPRYSQVLSKCPGVTVRHKPLSLRELKEIAREKLAARLDDSPFAAADYVQLACMGRHSVRIEVVSGTRLGTLIVKEGRLWAATMDEFEGTAALSRLAFAGGQTRCATLRDLDPPRNLPDQPWEQLLLDAARTKDESDRKRPPSKPSIEPDELDGLFDEPAPPPRRPLPPPSFKPAPSPPPPPSKSAPATSAQVADDAAAIEAEFTRLVEGGADALLTKDYPLALQKYERAQMLRPYDTLVLANIKRLTEIVQRAA